MTLHAVTVPNWGLSMEEGRLSRWLVGEGAKVAAGDEIADIETSKIANVLEAPVSGVLRRRTGVEGAVYPVAALIGVIADGDESDSAIDRFIADRQSIPAEAAPVLAPPEAQTVELAGQAFAVLSLPARSDAPGVPLVLIHGFGGDHRNWMFNQAALAADRDVHAVDLPGHGASAKQVGDGSLDALAAPLLAWMDGRGLKDVHLTGHSMGGAIALAIAFRHPSRVRSIVGIASPGWGGILNRNYLEGFVSASRRKELAPFAEMLFADQSLASREMVDELIAYKRIDGVDQSLRALVDGALAPATLDELHGRLGDVQSPMLALFGSEDRVMRRESSDDPRFEAVTIAGTGHMPHVEAPDAVNARIAEFLRRHD